MRFSSATGTRWTNRQLNSPRLSVSRPCRSAKPEPPERQRVIVHPAATDVCWPYDPYLPPRPETLSPVDACCLAS